MDKTWMDVFVILVEALAKVVISVGIPYLAYILNKKIQDDEKLAGNEKVKYYMNLAQEYLSDAVIMVKQTFVDNLKAEGKFDADAQAEAFRRAMNSWLDMMSDEMKDVITDEIGDLQAWAIAKLERYVVEAKNQ